MAATKGAMTSLPTTQILFAPQVEEPEQNRINFRDSLKFFQEQLVINGGNFPSPSIRRSGADSRKNGSRSYKTQTSEPQSIKSNDLCENEIQTSRNSRISIPTVDTILESVRVLRAIQKSQQERGSTWSIDITSESDADCKLTDEWMCLESKNQDVYPTQEEPDNTDNDESFVANFADKNSSMPDPQENVDENYDMTYKEDECSISLISYSSNVNEICSFWPSNTVSYEQQLENSTHQLTNSDEEKNNAEKRALSVDIIDYLNDTNRFYTQNLPNEDEKSLQNNTNILQNVCEQIDVSKSDCLFVKNDFQIIRDCQLNEENINVDDNTEICDATNSVNSVSHHTNEHTTEVQESKETLEKPFTSSTEILKIETYDDLHTRKGEFLINQSIWKDNCSPNESNTVKIENNDSDSGIGTQRSASSLSPNNPIQMRKDSWSDTCSSQYASAECSPYHSFNSVFESSPRFDSSPAFTKENDDVESSTLIPSSSDWEESEKSIENIHESGEKTDISFSPTSTNSDKECEIPLDQIEQTAGENAFNPENSNECTKLEQEKDTYNMNFVTNYTYESPLATSAKQFQAPSILDICDNFIDEHIQKTSNDQVTESYTSPTALNESITSILIQDVEHENKTVEEDLSENTRLQKFTVSPSDLIEIVGILYNIKANPAHQIIPATDDKFEEMLFVLSQGAFYNYSEDNYLVKIEDSILYIEKEFETLLSLSMKYADVSVDTMNILKIDNKMGRCVYIRSELETLMDLKAKIEYHCVKHWQSDCLQLVHYPLKCHQNVVIIDLGSVSTRAGILMDQPTLPSLFFPTVCATDRTTGKSVYGMEALQPEVRQNSNLSFPVRPSIKITKHTVDIKLLEGLFKKIFQDLQINSSEYTVQVCLPRNLSINAQNDLVKLLLDNFNVKAVNLTNQALLTLYAHDVSTAIVVDIGDRTDVLPVVDGFIVESGVTRLPHGGQRLIHHMKHSLAERRISLSTEIDSFVVQYIIENLAYIAEDFDNEIKIVSTYPDIVKKNITLQQESEIANSRSITLDEARFAVAEGLFNPEMWGLDSPGIHHLVQKAIQATSVDVRKRIAENIYVSGGVTMLPGFVERLHKEVAKLSKAKIIPKVFASNYRYHCTYIGACKFAKMDVFPQVCVNQKEYNKDKISALKKFALY